MARTRRDTPPGGVPVHAPEERTAPILLPRPDESGPVPGEPPPTLYELVVKLIEQQAHNPKPMGRGTVGGLAGLLVVSLGFIAPLGDKWVGGLLGRDQLERIEAGQIQQAKDTAEIKRALADVARFTEALDGESARANARPVSKMPASLRVLLSQEDLRAEMAAETAEE